MKRIIAFAIALGTFSFAANANVLTADNPAVEIVMSEDGRTQMTFEELPEAVKTSFQESDYSEWEVQSVFKVSPDDQPEQISYELTVTDGTQPTTLIYDEEGKIVE